MEAIPFLDAKYGHDSFLTQMEKPWRFNTTIIQNWIESIETTLTLSTTKEALYAE